jgi:hypothetical protein
MGRFRRRDDRSGIGDNSRIDESGRCSLFDHLFDSSPGTEPETVDAAWKTRVSFDAQHAVSHGTPVEVFFLHRYGLQDTLRIDPVLTLDLFNP